MNIFDFHPFSASNLMVAYSCQFLFGSRLKIVISSFGRFAVITCNRGLPSVAFKDALLFVYICVIVGFQ